MEKQESKLVRQNKEGGKMLNGRDVMTNRAIAELYRLEKIFKENEAAARTLYRSCLQSYQRTTDKTKPAYKEVEFHFDNPLDMTIQFITNLPKEWEKWQMQQLLFDDRDQESNYKMRPSIDRKNSNGHYEINNIQTDSIKGNYTEASNRRRKKTALIEIKNGELRFKVYESQTEIKDEFNISNTKLNSMKKQPYKLGVLKEDGAVMALGKQIIAMEYKEYPPRQKEEQIRLDKQSYIDLKERIELLEGLSFDKKRSDHIEKLKGNLALYRKFGWDKL